MKRTKRYGGFLVGDRVRVKGKNQNILKEGKVIDLHNGYCGVHFDSKLNPIAIDIDLSCNPNNLINLTRIEEEKIQGLEDEINRKWVKEYGKWVREHPPKFLEKLAKDEHLITKSEMNEKLKNQSDSFDELAKEIEHKSFADHSLSKEDAQEFAKDMLKEYLDEKEIEKRAEEAINNNSMEIELQDNCGKRWCHIEDDGANTFIGMYEDGEVKRKLFLMNRKQLKQLVKALKMIINAEV